MEITSFTVETVKDPFGIIAGTRYEYMLELEVDEEDELYSANGVYLRVIYSVEEDRTRIVKYELYERSTDRYLEFDLEEDELAEVDAFCSEHLAEAEE
ncbi:DUF6509 family protein [Paenibacillus sp. P96]|uniref:DUF6509 family protein n=1 Tax=Paenibacillus zeirhizosphaerae TaxID=2987519 RepID=A0ABT9FRH5_9BACL|nr:DUF6509 family protein [Paenibacillus sp. P96]MDP4097300.1 DUF6509 family protein [Paenibacillus sp. P96]